MANLPSANNTLQNGSGVYAVGSTGYIAVMACVSQNADMTPRLFSSAQDMLSFHGYAPGVDYCALHFDQDDLPVLFMGLPIATAGVVRAQNNTGVTGTAPITVAAASSGILEETFGVIIVTQAGTVGAPTGTTGPNITISLDGGQTTTSVRLGSLTSYSIPYVGIVLNFGSGTLNVGDVFTFNTSAPLWATSSITTAFTNLAAQLLLVRSVNIIGDMTSAAQADVIFADVNNYASEYERFTYCRTQAFDRLPLPTKAQVSVAMVGAPSITFAASGFEITRATGSFVTDGFVVGDVVTVSGSTLNNGVIGALTAVSATQLTFASGIVNEGPDATGVAIVASDPITFAASGETITRVSGSWIADGFAVGDQIVVSGTTSNNNTFTLTNVTATVLTVSSGITNEGPKPSASISIQQVLPMASWVNNVIPAFVAVAGQPRIDIAAGRGRIQSEITGWSFRRPAAWAASLREYLHDVQIPTYRKSDGALDGWTLANTLGVVVEYDERTVGGLLEAGFTTLRTYANEPSSEAFVALSLTRDNDGNLTSRTHNLAVVNVGMTTVQNSTEGAIGQVLELNANGTGTDASLSVLEQKVNSDLQTALLSASLKEGPRCSSASWTASRTAVLNTPGATLPGSFAINLNGTLEQISTVTSVS